MGWFRRKEENVLKDNPDFVQVNKKGALINVTNVTEVNRQTMEVIGGNGIITKVEPKYWDNFIKVYTSRQ